MDVTPLRKLSTIIGILLIVGAAYLNLLGILEASTTKDKQKVIAYTVSANIINGLAVFLLIILTINSTRFSSFYKVFLILILLGGLIAELYFIGTEVYTTAYGSYATMIVNLLIRVYYLIYYFRDSWAMFPSARESVVKLIVDRSKTVVPSERVEDSASQEFIDQWKTLFRQARAKVGQDNLDEVSREKGYREVILPALSARDFSKDRLRDAAGYLKDKSGNVVKDLVYGGRKRR